MKSRDIMGKMHNNYMNIFMDTDSEYGSKLTLEKINEIDKVLEDLDFSDFDIDFLEEEKEGKERERELISEDMRVAQEIYDKARELEDTNELCEWIKYTYLE